MLIFLVAYFAVPENIHTPPPPQKGLEFPGGWPGGFSKTQKVKEMYQV